VKQFLIYAGVGLVLVTVGIVAIFYVQRGAQIQLKGRILKVRVLPVEPASTVAILDFRFANPADYEFFVRKVDVYLEDANGVNVEGSPISDVDATRLFEYYPILGQKFNESLLIRTRVKPGESLDRMVAARFELPLRDLETRKRFKVRVEDVDGAVSAIVEERAP